MAPAPSLFGRVPGAYDDVKKCRAELGMGCNRGLVGSTHRCHVVANRQFSVRWRRLELELGAYFPDWRSHLVVGYLVTRPAVRFLHAPAKLLECHGDVCRRCRHWSHFLRRAVAACKRVLAVNRTRVRAIHRWRDPWPAGGVGLLPAGANPFSSALNLQVEL